MASELLARLSRLGWAIVLLCVGVLSIGLLALTLVSGLLIVVWVGVPLSTACVLILRQLAGVRRRWAGDRLGVDIPSAYLQVTDRGMLAHARGLAQDRSTWRDLLWLPVAAVTGTVLAAGALVESLLGLIFWWLPRSLLLVVDAQIVRAMLAPSEKARLAARVQQLTQSRADTVDTQSAELRRIERDLHDGAQARLVSLAMSLGLAEDNIDSDPVAAKRLLGEARAANTEALSELRGLVRGILPPILADRGLTDAVQALALAAPIAVQVDCVLPERLPPPLETAAYFGMAEALTNVIKHSGAAHVWMHVDQAEDLVRITVRDDGRGGAVIGAGSGLRGIERRIAAFDGRLKVISPIGGPTILTMELPCASSSPKISPSSGTA